MAPSKEAIEMTTLRSTPTGTNLGLALLVFAASGLVPARAALAGTGGELILRLRDSQGHACTHRVPVGDEYRDPMGIPTGVLAERVTRAQQAMANELGYTSDLYGADHHKLLGAVKVVGAWVQFDGQRRALDRFLSEPGAE
jgi:hypothetical protein